MANSNAPFVTDVIIIGGGMAGLTMAAALARKGLSVAILERKNIHHAASNNDGRASAISHGSKNILAKHGVWELLAPHTGPILDIRITDNESLMFLHFDHALCGSEPVGYMIENHFILQELYTYLSFLPSVSFFSPVQQFSIKRDAQLVFCEIDGKTLQGRLVIAADGRQSATREQAGIHLDSWDYPQTAIVCTIHHQYSHEHIAQERFLPAGPFAILPLQNPHLSSIVWTEKRTLAPYFMAMNDAEFLEHLAERFGDYLGTLTLASGRFSYPLSVCYASRYHDVRLALIGDAAHGIHPIAGQGFNLGIRDIAVLADSIIAQHQLGLDIGSPTLLENYTTARRPDNIAMITITDLLNRLFSNDAALLKYPRRLGLSLINRLPPVQKFLMRYAMGSWS